MKFRALPILILSIIVFALVPAAMAQDADPLVGSEWQLVSSGSSDAPIPVVEGSSITLEFGEDNQVSGSGGCNAYFGNYTLADDSLTFSAIGSTKMACADEAVGAQESAYFQALEAAVSYELTDDQLIISYGEGEQLVFAPSAGLDNSQWQLVSYGAADDLTAVIGDTPITLEFTEENLVAGSSGCNTYGGNYLVDGDTINFSEVVSTLIACVDESVMGQEQAYLEALLLAQSYELAGDQLTINYGEGQQLVFTRINSLKDTQWQLAAYGTVGEETTVPDGAVVTLIFNAENQVGGSGGCNTYGGSYTVAGENITFSEVFSTLMACVDDEVSALEAAYFEALNSATRYKLSGDQLIIEYGEGQHLIFTRTEMLTIS